MLSFIVFILAAQLFYYFGTYPLYAAAVEVPDDLSLRSSVARDCGNAGGFTEGKINVGAGLLAKAVVQSPDVLTDTPYSRASPLPHKLAPTLGYG